MDAAAQPALKDTLIEIQDINVGSHTQEVIYTHPTAAWSSMSRMRSRCKSPQKQCAVLPMAIVCRPTHTRSLCSAEHSPVPEQSHFRNVKMQNHGIKNTTVYFGLFLQIKDPHFLNVIKKNLAIIYGKQDRAEQVGT